MSSSATITSLATLSNSTNEEFVESIVNIRFITTSIYVCLILEHISTIPKEVEFIWKAPHSLVRLLFLLFRYSTLAGITILTHSVAGIVTPLSQSFCKHVVASLTALSVLAMGIADMIVVLRVSVLWGRQRTALLILATAFILTYLATIACAAVAASQLVKFTSYNSVLRICIPEIKPDAILGVWIPGMVFDVIVLFMTSLNAFSRPRNVSTPLTIALYRDGITFFLILAGLRALNLFMTIFSTVYLVGICVSWPLSAIVLSRLIFHLQHVERVTTPSNTVCIDDTLEEEISESKESIVLDISTRHCGELDSTSLHMWEIIEAQSTQSHNRSISHGSASLMEIASERRSHSAQSVT